MFNSGPFSIAKKWNSCYFNWINPENEAREDDMEILWNEVQQEIPDGTTVSEFLTAHDLLADTVVIELNDQISGAESVKQILRAGDRLDVFRIPAKS